MIRGNDRDLDVLLTYDQTVDAVENKLTELLKQFDPRLYPKNIEEAMNIEIAHLMERYCFKVGRKKSIPFDASLLGRRSVMDIKTVGTLEEKIKEP